MQDVQIVKPRQKVKQTESIPKFESRARVLDT